VRGLRVAVADGKGDRPLGGHEETAARFALTMRCYYLYLPINAPKVHSKDKYARGTGPTGGREVAGHIRDLRNPSIGRGARKPFQARWHHLDDLACTPPARGSARSALRPLA
jgi:hypothetical protein